MKRTILCIQAFSLFLVCGCADNAKKAFESGDSASQKGDFDTAITGYTEAIRLNPKYSEAYYKRGLAYGEKGETDKVIADLTDAIRLDPKFAQAYKWRGVAFGMKGETDKEIARVNCHNGLFQ